MYGGSFSRVEWMGKLPRRSTNWNDNENGLHVVEICTNREENLKLHREVYRQKQWMLLLHHCKVNQNESNIARCIV